MNKEIKCKQMEIRKHYEEIAQLEKQIEELQMKSKKIMNAWKIELEIKFTQSDYPLLLYLHYQIHNIYNFN